MNSRNTSQNAQKAAAPLNNYEFDFGLGSKSRSGATLNAQKQNPAPPQPHGRPSPSWTPQTSGGGASWTHKPSSSSSFAASWTSWSSTSSQNPPGASLNGPARSMIGDISGKSWGSMDNSKVGNSGLVGGLNKGAAPDLFGDLVKGSFDRSSAPIKEASRPSFAMASVAASLPKGESLKDAKIARAKNFETADQNPNRSGSEMGNFVSSFPSYADPSNSVSSGGDGFFAAGASNASSSQDVWGAFEDASSATKSASGNVHDPFFVSQSGNSSGQNKGAEDPFGEFQGGSSFATAASSASEDPFAASVNANVDLFDDFSKPSKLATNDLFGFAPNVGAAAASSHVSQSVDSFGFSQPNNTNGTDPFASLLSGTKSREKSNLVSDPFESLMKSSPPPNLTASTKYEDPLLEKLWSSSKAHPGVPPPNSDMLNDWGMENDFGEFEGGTTTELEGLPQPPAGVTTTIARDKGMESYKQGQFADAIKWLSWAENTMESSGDDFMLVDVLTCRASCLKEVGEYKKAVADCSKVMELDKNNMAVLLQRALLYESTEKYKLGIADLREVLRKEPQNRVASNTLSRLIKMGE